MTVDFLNNLEFLGEFHDTPNEAIGLHRHYKDLSNNEHWMSWWWDTKKVDNSPYKVYSWDLYTKGLISRDELMEDKYDLNLFFNMTDENFESYIKGKITIGYLIENSNRLYMLKSHYKKDRIIEDSVLDVKLEDLDDDELINMNRLFNPDSKYGHELLKSINL